MKLDKIIFSTSERFSVFWNLNAKLWKCKLGIEPVCLFFGDRNNVEMSEEHGKIINVPIIPDIPLLIQITWSKFYWPIFEPETTWIIGDIDLLPLSAHWFTSEIVDVPGDQYLHLDADGICQLSGTKFNWANKELNAANQPYLGHDNNLPGHYHCGKGKILKIGLDQNGTFEQELRSIVERKMGGTRAFREDDPIEQHNLWCAEENRSTRSVRRNLLEGNIKFTGKSLKHGIGRITGDRIDKSTYDDSVAEYGYGRDRLARGEYVDLHCIRPFHHYLDSAACQNRRSATEKVLKLAGMVD